MKRPIESQILEVRGRKVILASDLAELYRVQTKRLNQQVRRNLDRFPEDFCFQLTAEEAEAIKKTDALRSQIVTLKRGRHSKYLPLAFTEHGAIMAATVLNTPQAVAMSVYVVRAFVQMREQIAANAAILKRLAEIDQKLLEHDDGLMAIWTQLEPLLAPPPEEPKRRIGFKQDE
jgi:hypothetical protein